MDVCRDASPWPLTPSILRAYSPLIVLGGLAVFTPLIEGGPMTFPLKPGMMPLPPSYFIWLFGILLTYSILTQWVKVWFIKRFQSWL